MQEKNPLPYPNKPKRKWNSRINSATVLGFPIWWYYYNLEVFPVQFSSYYQGKQGELFVQSYLIQKRWKIVCTNYKTNYGEIDIVALDGKELVFVEVKSGNSSCLELAEKVSSQKKRRISLTILHFLKKMQQYVNYPVRFDVIVLVTTNQQVYHFKQEFFE